ncbi:MAG: class I SAM-dependent methyltransferase [Flavobacteriales bacterium]|nr:class I SAM-dependent methyltransferase [Flavobacteriales bacterium]HRH70948.1 class I SAM-dependent methyltransferase [Flavobacteriales bacterium]
MSNPTRSDQERIYKELFEKHKGTTMAVSSESPAHKRLRFGRITDIVAADNDFTIHDVGMGLADMYPFLKERFPEKRFVYSGTEILQEYVTASVERFPDLVFHHRDIADQAFADRYDYVVMSGVFHQRRGSSIRDWEAFAQNIIRNSFRMCRKGIAFNFISPFVDFYQTQVYYSNLPKLINFINDDLSRFFEIKHNYALFEFTVFVHTEEHVRSMYPEPEFAKYFKADR